MRSNKKGISFQVILMIVAIATGAVALLVVSSISEEAVKNVNYGCLIGNSFKNMMGDTQYDSGKGYCKVELLTIRAPDFSSNAMFKDCEEIMLDKNNYEASIEHAYNNPKETVEKCVAYQVMDEAEECWANYLLGEAQFDGKCDRVCFADGFSGYVLEGRTGVKIIPDIKGSELYFFPGTFNSEKLDLRLLEGLIPYSQVRSQYGKAIKLTKRDMGDKIKIEYEKPLGSRAVYSIVQRIPSSVSTEYLSYAIDIIEADPERTGLKGAGFTIGASDRTFESGEEWEINYHEEENIYALTVAGAVVGARFGGKKGATLVGSAGLIADSYIGTALAIDGSAISLNKRGVC